MLLAATYEGFTILDGPCLKNAPPSLSHTQHLSSPPTAVAWSSDNAALFIAVHNAIHKHDPSTGASLKQVCVTETPVSTLLTKDKSGATLIFASNTRVLIYSAGKIINTFDTHKPSTITSLSLSNDGSLLASASASAVHVHNLTLATPVHVALKNLPPGHIATCAFHSHSRTRLFLGIGRHLAVYDTTRPSSPIKVVAMGHERDVLSISCSPFSKTLVAVACSGGAVGLVDLDKEKPLFRILDMKVPLTALSFSADGSSFYIGTENGKLLLQDLRGLDKPPKAIVLSEYGSSVVALAVQKKTKAITTQVRGGSKTHITATSTSTTAKPLTQQDANNPLTERQPSATNATKTLSAPTAARRSSINTTPDRGVSATARGKASSTSGMIVKSAFSPTRPSANGSDLSAGDKGNDISVQIETLTTTRRPARPVKDKENLDAHDNGIDTEQPASSSAALSENTLSVPVPVPATASGRLRAASKTWSNPVKSATRTRSDVRSGGSASANAGVERAGLAAMTHTSASRSVSPAFPPAAGARTPSPDLPAPEPVTPLPMNRRKAAGMSVLGLGTPEVERWIEAGKGKDIGRHGKKRVGFAAEDKGNEDEKMEKKDHQSDNVEDRPEEQRLLGEQQYRIQVSPLRSTGEQQTSSALQISPLRFNSPLRRGTPSAGPSPLRSSSGTNAKDLLHSIVRDVLYDLQQDTRAEVRGLHLDFVRMGRGWRQDLKESLDEIKDELRAQNCLSILTPSVDITTPRSAVGDSLRIRLDSSL